MFVTRIEMEKRVTTYKIILFKSQRYFSNFFYNWFFWVGWIVAHPSSMWCEERDKKKNKVL